MRISGSSAFASMLMIAFASGCGNGPARSGGQRDSQVAAHTLGQESLAARVVADTDTTLHHRADSTHAVIVADSAGPPDSITVGHGKKRHRVAVAHVAWPTNLPEPLPGSLLPSHRIVAYYGNPLSKRMGILGELPPDQMMAKLERTARDWAAADSTKTVQPALHLIVTVAQGSPGRDGKHRLRMSDSLIEKVARWAEQKSWLLFLDIQVGQSTVHAELPHVMPYLRRPYVHLALDPEFAMKGGIVPGRRIGTMDAAEINEAIDSLTKVVDEGHLPPKIILVHRFTTKMLTHASKIRLDPRAQVVIDMDGFGPPQLKRGTWKAVILRDPVWFTGFKLFYKNDKPMLTPAQVLELKPAPVYVQYQ